MANSYPVIFVHGFGGWGRGELFNVLYWGGTQEDYEKYLNQSGFESYTATVSPFSSNWDRACELYAYIKGTRVDYGKAHSSKYGHDRYGMKFRGVYKKWSPINKIHLISHSMGGQTVRVLSHLLKQGSLEEIESVLGKNPSKVQINKAVHEGLLSPLFVGSTSSIHSITTIASPHDGTTLTQGVLGVIPYAQKLVALGAAQSSLHKSNFYDFKLDHWGLYKGSSENFIDFAKRVWESPLWNKTKDISAWDLSPQGAMELNSWVKAQDEVYYFSWSTEKTKASLLSKKQIPKKDLHPILIPFALFMGSFTDNDKNKVSINRNWFQNDGVVNTISMNGPKLGSKDIIKNFIGSPQRGIWNHMGLLKDTDHMDIISLSSKEKKSYWYKKYVEFLYSLDS
ncbi:MAG: lipase [Anaeromicrobium sp.]|jgi:triacylglycerol lipase|uniref:esterase/lipase family protein n=1 Tax=Anaeromicrobium sp. TaxID=1929132 RepID=UPI0025FA3E29|nr:lipase [Anaeromicrobium sp.]MCT4593401.1 lipase [Anaeromicrobium sp.]